MLLFKPCAAEEGTAREVLIKEAMRTLAPPSEDQAIESLRKLDD